MQVVKTLQTLSNGGKADAYAKELIKKAWTETTKDSIRDRFVHAISSTPSLTSY
jgi:hypothetical protein